MRFTSTSSLTASILLAFSRPFCCQNVTQRQLCGQPGCNEHVGISFSYWVLLDKRLSFFFCKRSYTQILFKQVRLDGLEILSFAFFCSSKYGFYQGCISKMRRPGYLAWRYFFHKVEVFLSVFERQFFREYDIPSPSSYYSVSQQSSVGVQFIRKFM